jgi:N-acyl-D-aspartate/D-glutamate deacylase
MEYRFLIKGGTVVDGSGAPAKRADVRIADGMIVEVAENLEPVERERVVDASGCYVTPGFIETHNHYDAPMWWMPNLEPMSGYGITTSVNGNCGFSAAPISADPEAKMEMVKIFSFFEDIPQKPFVEELPWDWSTWSEYRRSMEEHLRLTVNFASYVGHIAIRLAVMGMEARERAATAEEIAGMCDLLRDALDAGAIGLSSNLLDYDGQGRPVPSLLADDAEFEALLGVLAEYPGKTLEIIVGVFLRMTAVEDMERVERLCKPYDVRVMWAGIPTINFQMPKLGVLWDMHKRYGEEGLDFYTAFHHVPPTTAINFYSSLVFGQSNNLVWHEIIEAPDDEAKTALLTSDEWRARARDSWEQMYPQSLLRLPERVHLQESQSGSGPIGVTLADYIAGRKDNPHPSDALADWLLDNGFDSTLMSHMVNDSEELMTGLLKDPRAIGNISDSGAHGQMLCGIGDHINLLTEYARDKGLLTIEEAVHNLTGKLADFFGFNDRGKIEVGKAADIVVFNLDEIERRPTERVFDVPDGKGARTWRYTRPPAPMRLTLVNGVPTFDRDRFDGTYPGKFISTTRAPSRSAAASI